MHLLFLPFGLLHNRWSIETASIMQRFLSSVRRFDSLSFFFDVGRQITDIRELSCGLKKFFFLHIFSSTTYGNVSDIFWSWKLFALRFDVIRINY